MLYSTTSAPHDHDLNPIAESTINVISTLATSYKSQSGAPIGFWPEVCATQSIGTTLCLRQRSAPPHPIRRSLRTNGSRSSFPRSWTLAAFGARTVVLKPPTHQSKTTLASRGWVGMFLGRSSDAIGTWEVWVPAINRKVRSSSLTIDEEFFPWHGADAHQPLAIHHDRLDSYLTTWALPTRWTHSHSHGVRQVFGHQREPAPESFVPQHVLGPLSNAPRWRAVQDGTRIRLGRGHRYRQRPRAWAVAGRTTC